MPSRRHGRCGALLIAFALLGSAAPALAQQDGFVELSLTTDFPLGTGVRLGGEFPFGLRVSTSLGTILPGYREAAVSIAGELGALNQAQEDLISESIDDALSWRTHVGIRAYAGFYVDAGYGLLSLRGRALSQDVLAASLGIVPPFGFLLGGEYEASSLIHMIDVELGYRWIVGRHLLIRAALGGAFTVAASTDVEPPEEGFGPATALFASQAEDELNDFYKSYLHLPVVSVSVGYAW